MVHTTLDNQYNEEAIKRFLSQAVSSVGQLGSNATQVLLTDRQSTCCPITLGYNMFYLLTMAELHMLLALDFH